MSALILLRSGLGLLMGKFSQFLTVFCPPHIRISFLDDNLRKSQWIFSKLGLCIDIIEVWFWTAYEETLLIFDRVICPPHDSGGVLSLHVFIFSIKFLDLQFFVQFTNVKSFAKKQIVRMFPYSKYCNNIVCALSYNLIQDL